MDLGTLKWGSVCIYQGRSHEIWSGTVAVEGDAAEGGSIEARTANRTAKYFSFSFLSYQDGLSWHLCALKTRKRHYYLNPSISSSVYCSHMAANRSAGCAAEVVNIDKMWLLPRNWSGWNLTNRTGGYGPAYIHGEIRQGAHRCK